MKCPRCKKHIKYPTKRQLMAWTYRYGFQLSEKEAAARMNITPRAHRMLLARMRKIWPNMGPVKHPVEPKITSFDENRDSEPKTQF
jgi:hypothetical protein